MKVDIPKYEENKYIGMQEVEVLAQVKYMGDDTLSFENGKIYNVIGIEGALIRVIDESGEDYLYSFNNPNINNPNKEGRFELVNDFTNDKKLEKLTIN